MPVTAMLSAEILARTALNHSKRKIARDLHVGTRKIDAVISQHRGNALDSTRIAQVTDKAIVSVDNHLPSDPWLAMEWLGATLFKPDSSNYTIEGDLNLQQTLALLPTDRPGALSSTEPTSTPSTTGSTGTEAAAKPPGSEIGLSSHTNFSEISTADLRAELERRMAAESIDAEVVEAK